MDSRFSIVWCRMSSAVAALGTIQPLTSRTVVPKPRLFFLLAAGWMYKRLENFCIRLQIPHICPHALRGLHSSLALAAGATSQHVAAALGHASFSTTSRHYATRESIEIGRARNFVSAMTSEPGEALREALAQHGGNTTKPSRK